MASKDPFSLVYDAVWTALKSHKPLMDLVRSGNLIRFDGDTTEDPEKENVQEGDLPELMLRPAAVAGQPWATSSSARATQSLELRLTTGDLRATADGGLYAMTWAVFSALITAGHKLGLDFVERVDFESFTQTREDSIANRGTAGWAATAVLHIELIIKTDRAASGDDRMPRK